MAISRKHIREVAEIISRAEHVYAELPVPLAMTYVAAQLAHMFAEDNSDFDRDKFLDACRPPATE